MPYYRSVQPNYRYLEYACEIALWVAERRELQREKCFRRAVYYLLNSIDRQTSLEIWEFTRPGRIHVDKSQDRREEFAFLRHHVVGRQVFNNVLIHSLDICF